MFDISLLPILEDNYSYILHADNGQIAVVDPGEAEPVIEYLDAHNLKLDFILNTHHHGDHIAGNSKLVDYYNAKLIGPAAEQHRIAGMVIALKEGESFAFGGEELHVIDTPGHTAGHICFHAPSSKALFAGDTLFSMGTGRLFEGSAKQMWHSLEKINALPDDTRLYCGHEYTLSNAEFCLMIEPENKALKKRYEEVKSLREQNKPTLPSTLGLEKQTNALLRAGSAERYAEIRTLKDNF